MTRTAADHYAARVDAVLAQRTRLRGPQPTQDLFDGIALDHPIMKLDPHRPLDENLRIIASYVEAGDTVVDVGGGAGRSSLPIASHCTEVINVEPSAVMCAGFAANAAAAGITNTRCVTSGWPTANPPTGTFALVNHVVYLTRDIVPFIQQLEQAGSRRVLITVSDPVPPSWHHVLYERLHGEAEEFAPGHVELVNVLWELGRCADIRYLPFPPGPLPDIGAPVREQAIANTMVRFATEQWTHWPLSDELAGRFADILESNFDELFVSGPEGFQPGWVDYGREVLITWEPGVRRG